MKSNNVQSLLDAANWYQTEPVKKMCVDFFFWLCWVFVATCRLSLVAASGGYSLVEVSRASHCDGFSCCRAQAPGCLGFNSCGMWVQNL